MASAMPDLLFGGGGSGELMTLLLQSVQNKQESLLERLDELDRDNDSLRSHVAELEDARDQLQQQMNQLTHDNDQLMQRVNDNEACAASYSLLELIVCRPICHYLPCLPSL